MDYLERPRSPRALGLLALAALLTVFAACQLVAGIQSRTLDPIPDGCSLPSGTGPQVRFANFAPNADALDVCIRSSGASWGEPIILNGGSGCGTAFPKNGFTYSQITVPFTAPGPTIDVKTVPGGQTCNAQAVGEVDGLKLQASPYVTTLMAISGASGQPKKLVALPEFDATPSGTGGLLRFVNALTGVGPIDVGSAAGSNLPTTLQNLYNQGGAVPYGGTLAKGQKGLAGDVEDNGYMPVINGASNIVAAPHGQTDAVLVFSQLNIGLGAASVYAVGLALNNTYPLEGLYCVEGGQPAVSAGNKLLLQCTTSALPTLSFDVFNPALYGPDSPDFSTREKLYENTSAEGNPISSRTSDVMCLVEVDLQADQSGIISAVKGGNYNYSYTTSTNLSTPFSNGGKTQDGGTCPMTQAPGCAGSVPQDKIDAAFACMEQFCSSTKDANGSLDTTTDCLTSNCMGALAPLYVEYQSCFDCVIVNVASGATYSSVLQTCMSNPNPPLGYNGFDSSMILSKYPIKNTDSYVLTSSGYRRSVLYAQVEFPGNLTVDFYCGFFITPLNATVIPYTGCFGNGSTDSLTAYLNENQWEAKQMADWIEAKSGASKNPAVIVGDWRVGQGQPPNTTAMPDAAYPPPTAIGDQTITYLASRNLVPVTGPNWPAAGQCNNCPGTVNLLNAPNPTSYFTMQPFLYNWPASSGPPLLDEQLIFTGDAISVGDAGSTPNAPISPYYGVNFHVFRPNVVAHGDAGATQ